jgi:hypothetical protein
MLLGLPFFGRRLNAAILIEPNAACDSRALERSQGRPSKVTDALSPFLRFTEFAHRGCVNSACYAARRS